MKQLRKRSGKKSRGVRHSGKKSRVRRTVRHSEKKSRVRRTVRHSGKKSRGVRHSGKKSRVKHTVKHSGKKSRVRRTVRHSGKKSRVRRSKNKKYKFFNLFSRKKSIPTGFSNDDMTNLKIFGLAFLKQYYTVVDKKMTHEQKFNSLSNQNIINFLSKNNLTKITLHGDDELINAVSKLQKSGALLRIMRNLQVVQIRISDTDHVSIVFRSNYSKEVIDSLMIFARKFYKETYNINISDLSINNVHDVVDMLRKDNTKKITLHGDDELINAVSKLQKSGDLARIMRNLQVVKIIKSDTNHVSIVFRSNIQN